MSGSMKPGRKTISIHALREEGDRYVLLLL